MTLHANYRRNRTIAPFDQIGQEFRHFLGGYPLLGGVVEISRWPEPRLAARFSSLAPLPLQQHFVLRSGGGG